METLVDEYDLIVLPQGGYTLKQLPRGEDERLRSAVAQGVDYIGICAGSFLAVNDLKRAEVEHRPLDMVSLLWVRTLDIVSGEISAIQIFRPIWLAAAILPRHLSASSNLS